MVNLENLINKENVELLYEDQAVILAAILDIKIYFQFWVVWENKVVCGRILIALLKLMLFVAILYQQTN